MFVDNYCTCLHLSDALDMIGWNRRQKMAADVSAEKWCYINYFDWESL
jgi:hypothetical protein